MALPGVFPKVAGDVLGSADFNAIQSNVSTVLGTGSGDAGYGQTGAAGYGTYLSTATRSLGNTVLASDLQNLKSDLDRVSQHQTGSATALNSISSSSVFTIGDFNLYNTSASTLYTNRLTAHSTALSVGAGVAPTFSSWNNTRTHEVSVTFASADAARYFFNAGGYVQIQPSISYGAYDSTKNGRWKSIFEQQVGLIRFKARSSERTGSVSPSVFQSTWGYYQNITYGSASWATLLFAADSAPYSANDYTVNVKINAAGTVLNFQIIFDDGTVGPVDEVVTTTTSSVISYYSNAYGITTPAPVISNVVAP